ncbi:MAG: nitroreductase family protein [Tissierellia bacterium]|nr:nitroreductase family protein [Tissierellia bacterium]
MLSIKKLVPLKIKQYLLLLRQYIHDLNMYRNHSSIIKKNTYEKNESEITLRYHAIEKGFLHNPIRYRFAKKKVSDLIKLLKYIDFGKYTHKIQIQSALLNLCTYYEYHISENVDISDYYIKSDYDLFRLLLVNEEKPINYHTIDSFFKHRNSDFYNFSISRKSVRNFTGERIEVETIREVIELANHAPSVCNRQPVNVHLVDNKPLIDKILDIQGGLKGYSDQLSQIILVTSDRNYYYTLGERNQFYIDGGIYLMNLLYALHFYGIGTCPAHWGLPFQADEKVRELVNLKDSEQIICLIAIGVPQEDFPTTLSLRRPSEENLFIHN